jgi:glutathione synthase/RimK-type ligase-like ATP-grasp enzyme
MSQLRGFDGLLWHWVHYEPCAQLVARQIIASIEMQNLKVFPNTATCWHFDDKIAQKYLLEAVAAPLAPSHVFFDKQEARQWIDRAEFPKVFKLRCGAGSQSVRLVKTKREAIKLCDRAFAKGFAAVNGYFNDAKTKARKINNMSQAMEKLRRMPKSIYASSFQKQFLPRQKGYIYFQDFLPDNKFDTRITVIGNRAFGFKRNNRPNDFRASGSGNIIYDTEGLDKRCIAIAFHVVAKLKAQSLAFDFILNENHDPQITEISYCYQNKAIHDCPGYWDDKMRWHESHVWPEDAILMDLLHEISHGTGK